MSGPTENYNEYIEEYSESKQVTIDSAINYAKEDNNEAENPEKKEAIMGFMAEIDELQSKMLSGIKVDFKTPDSINHFYKLEGNKIIFLIDQVRNYLADVLKRLQGMKVQKFGEVSKEKNFTGTILAIQIALKAMSKDPKNPKNYDFGEINGEYNEATKQAIKNFQLDQKIENDGKPGKGTIEKLLNAIDNLINNKKAEQLEYETLKKDVSNIINESIAVNPLSGFYSNTIKEALTIYIIEGNINSGKNPEFEKQLINLSNNALNRKLQYLLSNSDKLIADNIAVIQGRKKQQSLNLKNLSNRYTSGESLTESQKNTIKNKLSQRNSPVTIEMIADSCKTTNIPVEYLLGFMQNDSRVGTDGPRAIKNHNPGNVGNTDDGKNKYFPTRAEGVQACAENLKKRIDAYFAEKDKHKDKEGFNDFPSPEELASGKSKGGTKFFGIYMSAPDGPKKVASIVNTWVNRLKGKK